MQNSKTSLPPSPIRFPSASTLVLEAEHSDRGSQQVHTVIRCTNDTDKFPVWTLHPNMQTASDNDAIRLNTNQLVPRLDSSKTWCKTFSLG